MAFKWYVVHTYSGFEGKVKASIEEQVRVRVLDQKISKILVPTVDIVELRHGKKGSRSGSSSPDTFSWRCISMTRCGT